MSLEQPAWPRNLPPEAVRGMATLGPVGMRLPAPGTWGSAAGLVLFFLCVADCGWIELLVISAGIGYFAVGVCGQAEILIERRDPPEVILDEVVAMPLCFFGWQLIDGGRPYPSMGLLLAGFLLFRLYDIKKPLVIDRLQALPGGWGIVLGDTAAALATCLTLHLAHAVWILV